MRRRLIVTIAALVAIIAAVTYADANRLLVDLTAERALSLSTETRAIVAAVDRDVDITAFLRRSEPGRVEAVTLLDRYRRLNRRIDIDVVDPDEAPGEVRRLGIDPTFGGVAISSGDVVEIAPSATEQDLTSALARLLRGRDVVLCAATGHGERDLASTTAEGFSTAAALLEASGYELRYVDLLSSPDVPGVAAGCSALLLAGPEAPLGDALEGLSRWLADDGRLLLLTDPAADPRVGPLLDDVGLGIARGVVFEGDAEAIVAGDEASPIVRRYSSASPVVRRLPPTYFPGVQEVTVDDEPTTPGLTTSRLADTSELSYLETRPLEPSFDPDEDRPGPVTVAAAADRSRIKGSDIRRTRAVVVGDVDFASNAFVSEAGNARLLLQAVSWLTESEDLAALSSNLPSDRPLRLTDARLNYARVLTIGIVPGLFLLSGGLVWAVRRRR